MNDIESLISSFTNQAQGFPGESVNASLFMNSHDENALQQVENRETNQFFETQFVERAFISLRFDNRFSRYSQVDIEKMYNQVRRYIHLMGSSYIPDKTLFRFDDMSSRSIEVCFSQRNDISLNLFISESGDEEPDYEETYISYIEGGRSILVNDTMDGMVSLVKKLLGL